MSSSWRDGALLFLVQPIEHAQHVVAALQEEEVDEGGGHEDEASPVTLQVVAYFLEIHGFFNVLLVVVFLLLEEGVSVVGGCEFRQFEHLGHGVGLPDEEDLQDLLQSGLLPDVAAQQTLLSEPPAQEGHDGVDVVDHQLLEHQQRQL